MKQQTNENEQESSNNNQIPDEIHQRAEAIAMALFREKEVEKSEKSG